jgi:replicative DNA helicase
MQDRSLINEAECGVLGSLMLNPNVWDSLADVIEEKDFSRPDHQLIFRHIVRLIEQARMPDVLTIAESVQSTGKLERIGGLAYLGELVMNTPSEKNAKYYAKIVRNGRKEREYFEAVAELQEVTTGIDISAKIEKAVQIFSELADDKKNGIMRISEAAAIAVEGLEARYASTGDIHGLKTGLIDFDHKTGGLQPGDLIIVAGRPSMGKTAFAVNVAENVAIDDKTALIFSLEMSDEQLAIRSISSCGSLHLGTMRSGKLQDEDWPKLSAALGKIQDAKLFIDSNPMTTATQMHARARRIKRQHGLDLVVIDYLQLMAEGGDNRNNELSTITRKLKLMAKDLNVPVICLSQLSRKVEERADKRPMLSDLRDSGAIEQDADIVVMMYREDYHNKESMNKGIAEAIIAKQRMGETGTVMLTFQGEYSRFVNFSGTYHKEETKKKSRAFDDGKTRSAGD